MRILASLIALALSAPAAAADWWAFEFTARDAFFYDRETIADDGERHRTIWVESHIARPDPNGATHFRTQWKVDCVGSKIALKATLSYRANRSLVSSAYPSYEKFEPVPPDTIASGVQKMACASSEESDAASFQSSWTNEVTARRFFRLVNAGIDTAAAFYLSAAPNDRIAAMTQVGIDQGLLRPAQVPIIKTVLGVGKEI